MEKILLNERTHNALPDDGLFMSAFIPHKLDHIETFERDDEMERQGIEINNPFQKVIGKIMEDKHAGVADKKVKFMDSEGESNTESSAESESGEDESLSGGSSSSSSDIDEEVAENVTTRMQRLRGKLVTRSTNESVESRRMPRRIVKM
uniref:Uncharacterized protein n=1 Tax=Ditylenchus dipsaci TaxID=166011 RepID=A0A915CMV0_9BILA